MKSTSLASSRFLARGFRVFLGIGFPWTPQGPFHRVLMALNSGYLGYIRGYLGGLGRVQDSGFQSVGLQGFGFRVSGFQGFRVQGFRGFGFTVQGSSVGLMRRTSSLREHTAILCPISRTRKDLCSQVVYTQALKQSLCWYFGAKVQTIWAHGILSQRSEAQKPRQPQSHKRQHFGVQGLGFRFSSQNQWLQTTSTRKACTLEPQSSQSLESEFSLVVEQVTFKPFGVV